MERPLRVYAVQVGPAAFDTPPVASRTNQHLLAKLLKASANAKQKK